MGRGEGERKNFKKLVLRTFVCLGEESAWLMQCSLYGYTAFDSPKSKAETNVHLSSRSGAWGQKDAWDLSFLS